MDKKIKAYLDFYKKAEKLKTTMRHSWLSNPARQESTAEHSWMLGLLAIVLAEELKQEVDLLKVLKMVIIHDLAEAITGDIPAQEISVRNMKQNKYKSEKKALKYITGHLSKQKSGEIVSLWEEFEKLETPEAKFAHSLDKIECSMQHNVSPISTWDQTDFSINPYYKNHLFDFSRFMRSFKDIVDMQTMQKVIKARAQHKVNPTHMENYKRSISKLKK